MTEPQLTDRKNGTAVEPVRGPVKETGTLYRVPESSSDGLLLFCSDRAGRRSRMEGDAQLLATSPRSMTVRIPARGVMWSELACFPLLGTMWSDF
ncbi:hypothetical protein GY45DRAFT_341603 [Cubamyces sp. BRFM 1775]|nr:hypothetical protein GY45DRAFT_341603 [Cubamyces sp. BRFM 1775]